MASTLWLRAEKALEHRGRVVAVGDVFSATQSEATLYAYRRQVSFAKPTSAALLTRDMAAAQDGEVIADAPTKGRKGRRYHRRDLTADTSTE